MGRSVAPCTDTSLQADVYDIINCGPRQAFTVLDGSGRPLLAHNCPWPHQIPVANAILKALGKRDVRVVKSRAQGASWLVILIFTWCWLFMRGFIGNFVSKDEDAADKRNDMNALLPKIDWLLTKLPEWMVGTKNKDWRRNYGAHTFSREDGETSINGFACTADVASGGRATAFVLDEHAMHPRPQDKQALAATQPITRSVGIRSAIRPKKNSTRLATISSSEDLGTSR